MSIADSFLQGLQAPLQVPQAGLPMDMTPYVTALPDLKQHEQKVKEQARMQKYIDEMSAKIKKENLDALDQPSFLEGEEKMAFVSSNPWIRRKWLEKVANPPQVMSSPDEPQSVPEPPAEQPPLMYTEPQVGTAQEREIDLRNRFMEGRVNDADIEAYSNLLRANKFRQPRLTVPSNQELTDRARRNREQYQRRVQSTLDRAKNTEAYKTVGNYGILPGTTEVTNSPQDLEAIKRRATKLRGQNVVGPRPAPNTEGAQFFKQTRDSRLNPNPQQFPKLTSDQERAVAEEQRERRELINSRLNLLKPRNNGGDRVFSNDTQRLNNQISSYEPQPKEQSYSDYFSGLGNRLANLGTRLVRPVTTGAQQLASYALDQNMLGLADYVDDDQERLLNASLYHSTGDDVYKNRISQARQRAIDAARPRAYSESAYDALLSKVNRGNRVQTNTLLRDALNTPSSLQTPVSVARNTPLAAQRVLERDPSVIRDTKQLEQFEKFRQFRDDQRREQSAYDARLADTDFFTDKLVGAQLRPFGDRGRYGQNQQGYFDDAKDSITQAVKNYYGFEGGENPSLQEDYKGGLASPFRAAKREISDLYANPREYLREVALGLDKNNPLAPYAQELTEIGMTPEERAAEMLGMEADAVESSLLPLSMNDSQMIPGGEDYTAANEVMQELIRTPEGQQVARQLLRNVNPRLIQIQQALNAIDPNDREYYNKVTAILDSLDRQDLEALSRQNDLIQSVIGSPNQGT